MRGRFTVQQALRGTTSWLIQRTRKEIHTWWGQNSKILGKKYRVNRKWTKYSFFVFNVYISFFCLSWHLSLLWTEVGDYLPSVSGLESAVLGCCGLRPGGEIPWPPMMDCWTFGEESVFGKEINRFIQTDWNHVNEYKS